MTDIKCPICDLKLGDSSIDNPAPHLCDKEACRQEWQASHEPKEPVVVPDP